MSYRHILIGSLIFATLVIPIVQLSFGFHYIDSGQLCPLQPDIMLLMAIGGVFEAIFFAIVFAFLYAVIPSKYKAEKKQTEAEKKQTGAQKTAKGNNRAALILIGCITGILGACAIIFFVLIQYRVFGNYKNAQWSNSNDKNYYCIFAIYSSAFGLMIATYVAFIFVFIVALILLCGLCIPKK